MNRLLLFLIFAFFFLGRIFPYFKTSVPLGYDPGLYLYLFKINSQIPILSFTSLPDWIIEMYQPGIPFLAKILSFFLKPEQLLIPLIVFFEILLFWAVFLFAKKIWHEKAGLWAVFIFACSAIQFRFYWYYYLKNIAALSFLLFSFYFLASSSYWAIPFAILVVYFHQQTAVFLLFIILLMAIIKKGQRRYYLIVLGTTLAAGAIYYLLTLKQSVLPLVQPITMGFIPKPLGGTLGIASGSFYGLKESFLLSLPYFLPGVLGFNLIRRSKNSLLILASLLISLFCVVFSVFFSRRFIPFLDLFFVLLAGYGAALFFKEKKFLGIAYAVFLIIFITVFVTKTSAPLIFRDELREIKMLGKIEENAYVLVTDNEYTPWVYGYSNRRPIAPGFGEYDLYWTSSEWHQFWESNNREIEKSLLLKLPKPLYIYHGDNRRQIPTDFSGDCFKRINWRTYQFICEK